MIALRNEVRPELPREYSVTLSRRFAGASLAQSPAGAREQRTKFQGFRAKQRMHMKMQTPFTRIHLWRGSAEATRSSIMVNFCWHEVCLGNGGHKGLKL